MKIVTILLIPTLASAWHLQLYDKENYIDVLEDRKGSVGQPCKTLTTDKINRAESMHWEHTGFAAGFLCNVRLFDDNQCNTQIGDAQYGNWNLPAFTAQHKNKVNSYKIDCDD